MNKCSIYGLVDPRTMTLRYAGATRNALAKRVSQHLAPDKIRRKSSLAVWLRELIGEGLRPFILVLEQVDPSDDWRSAEKRHIGALRAQGHDLTNDHEGGTGSEGGWHWNNESRARLSRAKAGRSRGGSSRFPGVSFRRRDNRWVAQFCKRHLGLFDSEEEAFAAYQIAYHTAFGEPLPCFTAGT